MVNINFLGTKTNQVSLETLVLNIETTVAPCSTPWRVLFQSMQTSIPYHVLLTTLHLPQAELLKSSTMHCQYGHKLAQKPFDRDMFLITGIAIP